MNLCEAHFQLVENKFFCFALASRPSHVGEAEDYHVGALLKIVNIEIVLKQNFKIWICSRVDVINYENTIR